MSPHNVPMRAPRARRAVVWWRSAVIYDVYLPSFRGTKGKRGNDLAGAIEALPYLDETLGVDAVRVSPLGRGGDGEEGIDDDTPVDRRFGDVVALDGFVTAAHRRGLRVIVDYDPSITGNARERRAGRRDAVRFWLERGIDGFHVEGSPADGIMHELRLQLAEYGDRVAIWPHTRPPFTPIPQQGQDLEEFQLQMDGDLIDVPWDAGSVGRALDELSALPARAWTAVKLADRDHARIASRYGESAARTAAMLLLTVRGTPILYYGDELALSGSESPVDANRAPMPWDAVARQLGERESMLTLYRQLLGARLLRGALRSGSLTLTATDTRDCLMYERRLASERLVVVLNLATETRTVRLTAEAWWVVLSTAPGRTGMTVAAEIELLGCEGVILEQRNGGVG